MRIVHITAHLGGGIGQAISALVTKENRHSHRILTLEQLEKKKFADLCRKAGAEVIEQPDMEELRQELLWSDLTVLHWWDHPMMANLLAHCPAVPIRCILWCHISGCSYPALPFALLNQAQYVFFTTPYSYENREWTQEQRERIQSKSCVVYGSGLLSAHSAKTEYGLRNGICHIGYAGTFARSKMHESFPQMCQAILERNPDCVFLLAGDSEAGGWILEQAEHMGIQDHIRMLGYLDDMSEFWNEIDIFGYPLNPQHFGTTENVVLEAFQAGLPVVMLKQAAETYILSDPSAGILADGLLGYVDAIVSLSREEEHRRSLGEQARRYVCSKYAHSKIVENFQAEAEKLGGCKKRVVRFRDALGEMPIQWLLSGMPSYLRRPFEEILQGAWTDAKAQTFWASCPYILKERSKSSIPHFLRTFPEDEALQFLKAKFKLPE